jgi:hypothetical protein
MVALWLDGAAMASPRTEEPWSDRGRRPTCRP